MPYRQQLRHRLPSQYDQPRFFTIQLQPPDHDFLRDRYTYTYKIQPAARQNDPVIRLIIRSINDLNQHPEHGYLMCNNNIRVVPSTNAPPIWPPNHDDSNDVKFYTFFRDGEEFPATVPVTLLSRELPLTADKVHVRKRCQWMPLKEWLLDSAKPDIVFKRGIAFATQRWRNKSKQQFRLMDLPVELRLLIFEHAIAPTGEVYPLNQAHRSRLANSTQQQREDAYITLGVGYHRVCSILAPMMWLGDNRHDFPREARAAIPPPNLNLLYVNKQVKEEALTAGWEGVKHCFIDHQIFAAVADSKVGVAQRFNCLGRVQLSFDNASWFKFFGVKVGFVFEQTQSGSLGHYLSRLNNRASLEIRFRDPADGRIGDPWYGRWHSTACQTVLVDWILTLAYEHIKHIHNVRIVGCVRKPQKEMWQGILGQRVEYDNEHALAAMFASPANLPPACVCPSNCLILEEDRSSYPYGVWSWKTPFFEDSHFKYEDDEDSKDKSDDVVEPDKGPVVESDTW